MDGNHSRSHHRDFSDAIVPLLQSTVECLQSIDEKLTLALAGMRQAGAEWLSIRQAADLAAVSRKSIRRAIKAKDKAGRLPAYNVGTAARPLYRIAREDLDAWLRKRPGRASRLPRPPVFRPGAARDHFPDC